MDMGQLSFARWNGRSSIPHPSAEEGEGQGFLRRFYFPNLPPLVLRKGNRHPPVREPVYAGPRKGGETMESTGIFYAQAGNGHRAAALALREALGEPAPLVDVLGFATPWFRLLCSRGYEALGERAHGPCGVLYRATDRLRDESALVRLVDRMRPLRPGPLPSLRGGQSGAHRPVHPFPPPVASGETSGGGDLRGNPGGLHHRLRPSPALGSSGGGPVLLRQHLRGPAAGGLLASPWSASGSRGIPVRLSCASLHRSPRPVPRDPLRVLFSAGSIPEGKVLRDPWTPWETWGSP